MRKLKLHEFYQLEPKTGAFRLQVLEAYRKIYTGDELDLIPWAKIFDDLRKEPGFPVQSKEQWEKIRRNSTVRKLQNNQGAAKRHFMSLWYWLYKDHADSVVNKILNDAAVDLFESILEIDRGATMNLEGYFQARFQDSSLQSESSASQEPSAPIIVGSRVDRRKTGRKFLEHGLMDYYGQGPQYEFHIVLLIDVDDLTIINKVHHRDIGTEVLDVFETKIHDVCAALLFEREYNCGICGDDTFFIVNYSKELDTINVVYDELERMIAGYDWNSLSTNLHVTFSAGWAQREFLETSLSCSLRAEDGMNEANKTKGTNSVAAGPRVPYFNPNRKGLSFS